MQQIIKVTIEGGTPTIHVQGVKGKSCKDITRDLEKALGGTASSKPTSEFYEQQQKGIKASY